MGDRGTGKSVAVRALSDLLPEIDVVEGDAFNSSPTDPQLMGPEALEAFKAGLELRDLYMSRLRSNSAPGLEPWSLAQIEAARGRLIHAVAVVGETVTDYRILAPTEWNFHPQGRLAQALAGLDGKDDNSLRSQAALLIEAVDPCVGYQLRVQ